MAWLHTWTGLVVGWVLFFIFVTGTVGYFFMEVDRWMQPERPLQAPSIAPDRAVTLGEAYLRSHAPTAESWTINIPGTRETPHLSVTWRTPLPPDAQRGRGGTGRRGFDTTTRILHADSGEALSTEPRATGGGRLLYQMHWNFHYMSRTTAEWIVGVCTMIMFVAIITGVITHKKIFRDFFTFRPGKGQRSWLDIHNVISVAALPFFIMITFSGLIWYLYMYMPLARDIVFSEQEQRQERRFNTRTEPAGVQAPLIGLTDVLRIGEQHFDVGQVRNIGVQFPGDAAARITVTPRNDRYIAGNLRMRLDGVSGEVLEAPAPGQVPAVTQAYRTILGLHEGIFAGIALRWLFYVSGLLGCAMIATGLVLWTVKRRPKHQKDGQPTFGHQLVERLNVGTIAGLSVGIAMYFWANRLIPADFAARREWEVHAMYMSWAAMLVYPAFRPVMRAWIEELWLAAALFGLLPVLNLLTTDRHLGITLPYGDWALAGFDLTALAMGVIFGVAAVKVKQRVALAAAPGRRTHRQDVPLMPTPQSEVTALRDSA